MRRNSLLIAAMVLASAAWAFADDAAKPDRNARTKQVLDERRVSFDFVEQPATEAIDFLQTLGKVNIVADPTKLAAGKTVTLKVDNGRLGAAIDAVADQLKLKTAVIDGIVMVSDEPTLKKLADFRWACAAPKASSRDLATLKAFDEVMVSFTFNEQPVLEAFDFLQTLGKVNIVVDRARLKPDKTLSLKLDDAPLGLAVRLAVQQLGLESVLTSGVLFVSDEATVKEFAAGLKGDRRFAAARPTGADLKTAQILDETIVSFTFNEQPAVEAVDFLQTLGKVGAEGSKLIGENQTVTLKLDNAPLGTAWTFVAAQLGMTWVIEDGRIVLREAKK